MKAPVTLDESQEQNLDLGGGGVVCNTSLCIVLVEKALSAVGVIKWAFGFTAVLG